MLRCLGKSGYPKFPSVIFSRWFHTMSTASGWTADSAGWASTVIYVTILGIVDRHLFCPTCFVVRLLWLKHVRGLAWDSRLRLLAKGGWFRANSGFLLTSCETKQKDRTPVIKQMEIVSA